MCCLLYWPFSRHNSRINRCFFSISAIYIMIRAPVIVNINGTASRGRHFSFFVNSIMFPVLGKSKCSHTMQLLKRAETALNSLFGSELVGRVENWARWISQVHFENQVFVPLWHTQLHSNLLFVFVNIYCQLMCVYINNKKKK